MAQVITVTPNPLLDLVAGHDLHPGRVNRCEAFTALPGGKGVNVARVLARHGHGVLVLGFAGGPSGDWYRSLLDTLGLPHRLTPTAARLRCGFQAVGSGAHTSLMEQGFPVTAGEREALLAELDAVLADADLVICSGSVPDPACRDLLAAVAQRCAAAGTPLWLDAYGPAAERALAGSAAVALVKPNRQEFEAGGGWEAAAEIHLTDGPGAVRVRLPDGTCYEGLPPEAPVVNPVGSGDCYLAGLAHARFAGRPAEEQLRYALAAGTANAERVDVADLEPARIEALASAARVRKVDSHGL